MRKIKELIKLIQSFRTVEMHTEVAINSSVEDIKFRATEAMYQSGICQCLL
jgi:hypothetical protein